MNYVSTRGKAPDLAFDDVLLTGLARDGGLYVPDAWPTLSGADIKAMNGLSYAETAFRVIRPFVGDSINEGDLATIIDDTYAGFDHPDVAPLKTLAAGEHLMELFHGPTLAFKDYAMQFLGRMFDHVLAKRGERVTIVVATSGDTGPAALEACRGRDAIDIFNLYPDGRVSEVQRRQMTTVNESNVHNIAVRGTFDDCQNMVKAMFNDQPFRDRYRLSAVNSINWARVMAQIVYYFYGSARVTGGAHPVSFAVPTGNFGNVFAGYAAARIGLPIDKLIVGTNRNDILSRFFESGLMQTGTVHPTISPSMDIQISSNFERLLFELYGRDSTVVRAIMNTFKDTGDFAVGPKQMATARQLFVSARFDDDETKKTIRDVYEQSGELIDPHSAIGIAAGRACRGNTDIPLISLATAHPAKFPDAVEAACGVRPELPARLSDLFQRDERFTVLDNDLAAVQDFVSTALPGTA
ncbi:MAG: threonine synthase [Rhodospirillaceae bacterium]|nr:threonine synthase [Rhodospirillaceae bacterium]